MLASEWPTLQPTARNCRPSASPSLHVLLRACTVRLHRSHLSDSSTPDRGPKPTQRFDLRLRRPASPFPVSLWPALAPAYPPPPSQQPLRPVFSPPLRPFCLRADSPLFARSRPARRRLSHQTLALPERHAHSLVKPVDTSQLATPSSLRSCSSRSHPVSHIAHAPPPPPSILPPIPPIRPTAALTRRPGAAAGLRWWARVHRNPGST